MFIRNLVRLVSTPSMWSYWVCWNLRRFGIPPKIQLRNNSQIRHFRNFSEFWGSRDLAFSDAEWRFLSRYVSKPGAILDVGAHLGAFSLSCNTLNSNNTIHAFEPTPRTYDALVKNISHNRATNVCPHLLGLSRVSGNLSFLANDSNPTTNRIVSHSERGNALVIDVNVTSIDSFVAQEEIDHIAFLKIDVEGYEPEVLAGAAKTLKAHRCAAGLIELCPANLQQAGSSVSVLLKTVTELGYELRYLNRDGNIGECVTVRNAESVCLDNVALLPQSEQ